MSFPESISPRGNVVASDPQPIPGAFTGQARDLPAPFEFPALPAVQLLAFRTAITNSAAAANPTNALTPDLMMREAALAPDETSFRLAELANALTRSVSAPAALLTVPETTEFSLTSLANQLQSRFTRTDASAGEAADLLGESVIAPVRSVPSSAAFTPAPLPTQVHPGKDQRAEFPTLQTLVNLPAPAGRGAWKVGEKPPDQPAPKPATARQGDVFFMETPVGPPVTEESGDSGKIDLLEDVQNVQDTEDRGTTSALTNAADLHLTTPPAPQRPALIFPPALPAGTAPEMSGQPAEGGVGLVLGGSALILLGLYYACLLPFFWLTLNDSDVWTRQKTWAALVLHAAASLTALVLGTGSVLSCRWAPPLIHAAGWVAALTVSGIIAATGFHLVNADVDAPMPHPASLFQLFAALLVALGCIFYYQQESTTSACEAADPTPAWTDGRPVPALMVFLTGCVIAAGAGAMLCHQSAFSLPAPPALTGPAAMTSWVLLGLLGLAIAASVRLGKPAALWLLLLTALILAGTLSPAALPAGPVWDAFLRALGRPAAAGPPDQLVPLLAALIPAPLLLIFAMARRAFSSPLPPP